MTDDHTDDQPPAAATGNDETTNGPPPTQIAPGLEWSAQDKTEKIQPRSGRLTWGRAAVPMAGAGAVALPSSLLSSLLSSACIQPPGMYHPNTSQWTQLAAAGCSWMGGKGIHTTGRGSHELRRSVAGSSHEMRRPSSNSRSCSPVGCRSAPIRAPRSAINAWWTETSCGGWSWLRCCATSSGVGAGAPVVGALEQRSQLEVAGKLENVLRIFAELTGQTS